MLSMGVTGGGLWPSGANLLGGGGMRWDESDSMCAGRSVCV